MKMFRGMTWVAEVERDKGRACESCGRFLKIYRRGLSSSMAICLIRLHKLHFAKAWLNPEGPKGICFHVRDFDRSDGRGEVSKLALWGLVKEVPNVDTSKRASGLWMITQFGIRFAKGRELVPKYVLLKWGTELLGFAGPSVTIKDCLSSKFNYSELMNS